MRCKILLLPVILSVVSCSVPQPQLQRRLVPADSGAAAPADSVEVNRVLAATALQQMSAADYRVGPEDMLQITLFNIPQKEETVTPRTMQVRVSQQGTVSLPLLGEKTIAGLSVSELEQKLREWYDKYMYGPQVGIMVLEYRSQQVAVVGAVARPGVFPLSGPKTMLDILAMAGGVTQNAGRLANLSRQGAAGRESVTIDLFTLTRDAGGNMTAVNIPVQGGDVINIPEAGMFFVDGAVKKPGSYALNRRYTLTEALTTAGGVDIELAKTSGITVVRHRSPTEAEAILVNLDEILAGRSVDPQVEAEDVIVVPVSAGKYFVKRFVGTLFSGLSAGSFIY